MLLIDYWKDVPGWVGFYQYSYSGKIKSLSRRVLCGNGMARRKQKFLTVSISSRGYLSVKFYRKQKSKKHYLHQLAAQCFIGRCPPGLEVCHNDGNPSNVSPHNLRYDTHKNNMADAIKHGTMTRGTKNRGCILNEQKVIEIRKLLKNKVMTQEKIGEIYGVHQITISQIHTGRSWSWL